MKIEFTSPRISEYYNGGFHVINDGTEIPEVFGDLAKDLLAATHVLDGETVPVFQEVVPPPAEKPAPKKAAAKKGKAKGSKAAAEPTDHDSETVVTAESLAEAHDRDELITMAKEAGLDIDPDDNNYTDKVELAAAILSAKESD